MKKSGTVILTGLILLFSLFVNVETGQADEVSDIKSQAGFSVYPGNTVSTDNTQHGKQTNQGLEYPHMQHKEIPIPNNGSLKLDSVPVLNFGKINLSTIYDGAKIRLYNGTPSKINALTVADYRGYSKQQRGWSVSARITPLVNGLFSITPTVTLDLQTDNAYSKGAGSVTLTTKTATPVLTSLKIPTNGVKSATILIKGSSTLNFNSLSNEQRDNFQPGKYRGHIIWTLNNTASND